ncbi:MAG TPA: VOC family protein [Chthoniobacterales bacterium]|jgi:catechol 2,3-dioxygenase-like lactoylglutathione lyase family enzyme
MNITVSTRGKMWAIVAALGAFSVANQLQAQSPASPPTVQLRSFTIVVRDYDEAKKWYTEKLGFVTLIDQKFGPAQRFVLIAPPGSGKEDVGFVLEKARRDDPTMPIDYTDRIGKEVNIVLRTSDLSRLSADYHDRGVQFRQTPKQQPWGGEAIIEDLYGNSIVLVGPIAKNDSGK